MTDFGCALQGVDDGDEPLKGNWKGHKHTSYTADVDQTKSEKFNSVKVEI